MRIQLTDRVIVEGDSSSLEDGALPRQARLVLAYLVAERDRPVPRDELAELLWPGGLPQRWEKALAAIVSRLRGALASVGFDRGSAITSGFGCYQMRLPPGTWVDIAAADEEVSQAEESLDGGDTAAATAASGAAAAIARRGFLPGDDGPWVDRIRADLRGILIRALDCRVEAAIAAGDGPAAIAAAGEALELEPFREVGHQRLIRAQVAHGDHAEALRAFERCRALLADELGADPSPATQALHLEILRASGVPTPLPAAEGASPRTASPAGIRSNRASERTSFIGRRTETEEVLTLLKDARLVTITGVGGSGKTRLALHVCDEVTARDGRDVAFVDLTPTSDPADVVRLLASTLGVLDPLVEAKQSAHPGAIEDEVVRSLAEGSLVVVLDNCEHLVESCRRLTDMLLDRCSSVTFLATSHGPLGVSGERVYPLPPLGGPSDDATDCDEVAASEATQLFVDRARGVRPWFQITPQNALAVSEICRRLEGLPLAIELAASKTGVLSPSQIAERLDDAFRLLTGGPGSIERHQTLLATMEWTYGLLGEDDRAVLRRLVVFAGGCTLEAAERVCAGDPVDEGAVLQALQRLASKSLIVAQHSGAGSRYRLLEPVRQFALTQLVAAGEEEAVRERHRDWYMARAAGTANFAALDAGRAEALHADRANISAAFRWSLDNGDGKLALKIATNTTAWWRPMGLIAASAAMLDEALRSADAKPSRLRSAALGLAAWCESETGNLERSVERFREALEAARVMGDGGVVAWTLFGFGHALFFRGDTDGAVAALEESRELHRVAGDAVGMGWALQHLLVLTFATGDLAAAKAHAAAMGRLDVVLPDELEGMRSVLLGHVIALEGNVERGRELMHAGIDRVAGSPFALTWADEYLAAMEVVVGGDLAAARRHLSRAIAFQRDWGFVKPLAESLQLAACLTSIGGDDERAAHLFGAAETLRAETGLRAEPAPWAPAIAEHAAHVLERVGAASIDVGRALPRPASVALALGGLDGA